jgi:hypothetical protein
MMLNPFIYHSEGHWVSLFGSDTVPENAFLHTTISPEFWDHHMDKIGAFSKF